MGRKKPFKVSKGRRGRMFSSQGKRSDGSKQGREGGGEGEGEKRKRKSDPQRDGGQELVRLEMWQRSITCGWQEPKLVKFKREDGNFDWLRPACRCRT